MASLLVRRPARAGDETTTPAEFQKPTSLEPIPDETLQVSRRPKPTLITLPPEIHLLIARHLIYPDALALRHTNRHFYQLVDTGVKLKVEWLMERRLLHLECPSDQRCDLGSDLRFCRGSVKSVLILSFPQASCVWPIPPMFSLFFFFLFYLSISGSTLGEHHHE